MNVATITRPPPPAAEAPKLWKGDSGLDEAQRSALLAFLNRPTWAFGWKSDSKADPFSFWHKHFAGSIQPDHHGPDGDSRQYDCGEELLRTAPVIHAAWQHLSAGPMAGHRLLRCYANGAPYGSEGSVHTDSVSDRSFTAIYYPHAKWDPNWGGETIFFNREKTDILAAIYPKPNRLLIFPGTIPHVARGVSRTCPVLRITLMFKTELIES